MVLPCLLIPVWKFVCLSVRPDFYDSFFLWILELMNQLFYVDLKTYEKSTSMLYGGLLLFCQ